MKTMKKKLFALLQNKFVFLGLLTVVALSACKKDDVPSTPTAGLMAFNLIPDSSQPVVFVLNNNSITNQALSFSNYTGNYLPIYVGARTLEVYEYDSDSALATQSFTAEANKYYTAFAVGANGTYKNIIVDDGLDLLPDSTGKAYVRYINAIPDSSTQKVTISATGMDDVNGTTHFGEVSAFTGITPGDFTLNVTNDSTITANKTISLEKDKVYTVLLTGLPHATDTAKTVKIKYIINGTITP